MGTEKEQKVEKKGSAKKTRNKVAEQKRAKR